MQVIIGVVKGSEANSYSPANNAIFIYLFLNFGGLTKKSAISTLLFEFNTFFKWSNTLHSIISCPNQGHRLPPLCVPLLLLCPAECIVRLCGIFTFIERDTFAVVVVCAAGPSWWLCSAARTRIRCCSVMAHNLVMVTWPFFDSVLPQQSVGNLFSDFKLSHSSWMSSNLQNCGLCIRIYFTPKAMYLLFESWLVTLIYMLGHPSHWCFQVGVCFYSMHYYYYFARRHFRLKEATMHVECMQKRSKKLWCTLIVFYFSVCFIHKVQESDCQCIVALEACVSNLAAAPSLPPPPPPLPPPPPPLLPSP